MKYIIIGIFLMIGIGIFMTSDDRFPDYRYKMTVYIGDKTYSTVRQVRQEEVASIIDSSGRAIQKSVEGQAIIIERAGRNPVFALLSRPNNADYGQNIAGAALKVGIPPFSGSIKGDPLADNAYLEQQMVKVVGPKDLPRTRLSKMPSRTPTTIQLWPMFVTFADMNDPMSVKEVTPEQLGIKRITIEITDEEVSTGIEEILPNTFWKTWGTQHKEARKARGALMKPGDNSYFKSLAGKLNRLDFIRENNK